MNDNKKDITIRNVDQSGMYKMIEGIFKYVTYSQRECHTQMNSIRQQGWEIFETFRKEYMDSLRPRLFWGSKTTSEALQEANKYALNQMQIFLNGFDQQQEKLVSTIIEIAKESPEQFLTAIKGVLTEEGGNSKLQGPGEDIGQYALEEILKRMKIG